MMDPREHEELRALVAPYVLGAVTPEEVARVRSHLLSCEECLSEADGYAAVETSLALTAEPHALPEGFTDEVMARVAAERAARGAPSAGGPRPTSRRWRAAMLASVAVVTAALVVLGVGLLRTREDAQRHRVVIEALLRDRGMTLEGPRGAVGKMVPSDDGAVFVAVGLGEAPEGHDYQVWIIEPCKSEPCAPVSAGTFDVSASLGVLATDRSLENASAVAVTIEPEGGSERPTSDPIIRSES